MATVSINVPVVGTDGQVPVYNPSDRWCWWSIGEIYTGTAGQNRYVPKVNDYVMDPATYTVRRVESLDPVTLIPTLVEIRPANMNFSFSETDVLFGVGPGTQSDTYRAYVDKSVLPHVLAVDVRLKIAGSMSSYAKIFKGADLGQTGTVLSKLYDSNGNFISENVPLELVAIDSHNNYSIKSLAVCHCTEDLVDGEIITVVVYNVRGHVVSKRQLLVENTAFIRSINSSQKYVSHISADCAFMSPTLDKTIDFPLNIPTNALNLMGTVHYSDGSKLTLPVDGTKFKMAGIDQYLSSIVGQKVDLVLTYSLSPNETSYAGVGVEAKYVTEPYSLVTVNPNNSYTVKLFGYPIWVNDASGYSMKWFMLNLDRNIFYDVTPYVKFATNTGPFNPKGYGYLQHKSVSINLRDISGAFKPFVHTQMVDIVLNDAPSSSNTAWTVSHESNSSRLMYGQNLFAKRVSSTAINLTSGLASYAEWKQVVCDATYPLVNSQIELTAPQPTHFAVTYGTTTTEYPVADWNKTLTVSTNVQIYKTITINFIKRTSSGDLFIAVAAMVVKP